LTGTSFSFNKAVGPGATAFSPIPSGGTFSPQAENKFAKNGCIVTTTLADVDWTIYSFRIGKLWDSDEPWQPNGN
jgi:hypothetical protein